MQCKILKKEIDKLMSFGKMPLANAFIDKKNFESEFFYEMKVGFNENEVNGILGNNWYHFYKGIN